VLLVIEADVLPGSIGRIVQSTDRGTIVPTSGH